MTLFHVIYCARSDGKLEVLNRSSAREKNEPTESQLDATPDKKGVSDYYRPLQPNDSKHLDWRRKLAGMLARQIGGNEYSSDKAYILDNLPQNYRLYEHVKTKASDADKPPGKNHAGGGNDRQDAYLYGHPGGRKKRYRSPADFFPHLLWLCTDESGDMMNCSCKVCSPDEIQDVKAPQRGGTVSMKVEEQRVVGKYPMVEIPARMVPPAAAPPKPVTTTTTTTTTQSTPITPAQPSQAQRQAITNAPPAIRTQDQQVDLKYGYLSYRIGELAWYSTGATWALGIVLRRWALKNLPLPIARRYLIQPLAAPHLPQSAVIIEAETSLRPWLAWSVPPFCHAGLNQGTPTFASMNWNDLSSGRYGQSNPAIANVDASILAAKAIDASYTPFGLIAAQPAAGVKPDAPRHWSTHNTQWNGVYIGGERVWIGDPVRLRMSSNEDVLVVSQIIERPNPATPHQPKVLLTGNVFSLSTLASDACPPARAHLIPARMVQDLEARNKAITSIGGPRSFWKMLQSGQGMDLAEVKGRWYETSLMAPISNMQTSYEDCVRNGQTDSVARSFNARVDMHRSAGLRVEERVAAFDRAVPDGTDLMEGLEVPQPADLPRVAEVARPQLAVSEPQLTYQAPNVPIRSEFDDQMGGAGQEEHNDGGNLVDQFMDLGGMEGESIPGYGQEYGSQGAYFP